MFVDVHEVELGPTAAAIDEMLRGRVDVPADIEYFLIVESEAREFFDFLLGMMRCPGRCELPVEEVAWDRSVLITSEIRDMESGERLSRKVYG